MAEGSNTYKGLAVPLLPADGFEIKQQTASSAVDILSLTAASSGTGDFIVAQTSSGTEVFVVTSTGALGSLPSVTIPGAVGDAGVILQKTGTGQTTFARLRLPILSTAPASAGLTKGDIWLALATTDVYRFAICISTATGAPRYGHRFTRTTIGSASH